MKDYEHYDGLGLAELVRTRAVTAKELLTAAVERIEARNPAVNAVVNRMYDRAEAAIASDTAPIPPRTNPQSPRLPFTPPMQ